MRIRISEMEMHRRSVIAGLAVLLASALGSAVVPASTPRPGAVLQPATNSGSIATPVSRDLLDRYCVTCHNQRTKAEGRPAFDELDLGQVGKHAPLLEKLVRKLRSGQMPPDG